jgi:hypothetical protein
MDLSTLDLRLRTMRPFGLFIDADDRRLAVKAFAKEHGFKGAQGGWIYNANGRPVCQGWDNFFWMRQRDIADELTVKLTAFSSFRDMVERTAPTYRPTIRPYTWRERLLADLYDQAQERRNDPRRAYVGWDRYDRADWQRLRDQRDAQEIAS